MKPGDRIVYRGRKRGEFHGYVKHTRRWRGPQLALVTFDGACRSSRVEARHLAIVTPTDHHSSKESLDAAR